MLKFAFNLALFLYQFIPIDLEKSVTDGVPDGGGFALSRRTRMASVDTQGVSTCGNLAGGLIWLRRSHSTRRVRSCCHVPLRLCAMRWAPRPLWSICFEPLHTDGLSGYSGSIHARRLDGRLNLATWWTVNWVEAIVPSWAIVTARQRDGRSGRCGRFALSRRMQMASVGTWAVSAARLPLPAWCSCRIVGRDRH